MSVVNNILHFLNDIYNAYVACECPFKLPV